MSRAAQVHAIRQTLTYAAVGVPRPELDLDELRQQLPPQIAKLTRDSAELIAGKVERDGPVEWGEARRLADRLGGPLVDKLDALSERGHASWEEAAAVADRVCGDDVTVRGVGGWGGAESVVVDQRFGPVTVRGADDDGQRVAFKQW